MSTTNLEIVERAILAVNARDAAAYGNLCHRDWELVTPLAPLEGTLRGEAGVREFFSGLDQAADSFRLDVDELRLVGRDRVLAFLRLHFVSQGGVPLTQSLANVYDILDGKLRRVEVYTDPDEAREALELAE